MDRISTATKAPDLFGVGKHGFRDGDLGAGITPTDFNAAWFNGVQEEILNVLEAAGIVPAAGTLNQLLLALRAAGVFQTATALDSSTKAATTAFVQQNAFAHGQCRLSKSGANVVLMPFGGNRLIINGRICRIPSAGISLAPTGLVAGTLYYIYARDADNDGVVDALEASVTGHSTDSATGVEIKTGDATRTLVGMARPIAGPAFVDSGTQRLTLSWFNRKGLALLQAEVTVSNINTVDGERTAANRCEFLCWEGELVRAGYTGHMSDAAGGAGTAMRSSVNLDGVRVTIEISANTDTANRAFPSANSYVGNLAEGFHYSSLNARTVLNASGAINAQNWAYTLG